MGKKKKALKIFLWIVAVILAIVILIVAGAYAYFKFVISKNFATDNQNLSDSGISFTDVAKELADKQVIDNIINFDKQSASEMLAALNELEQEADSDNKESVPEKKPENNESKVSDTPSSEIASQVPQEGKTAYQRIMNTASKDEISQGMSIISKIDMAKVNELRKQGKTGEIKAYVKSVLSPGEISAALSLYKKYKHLL